MPRLEFETYGRIASAVAEKGGNRAFFIQKAKTSAISAQFRQLARLKTDRLLAALAKVVLRAWRLPPWQVMNICAAIGVRVI